jgi:asparagine synthase (glutamine-hydrolysing)
MLLSDRPVGVLLSGGLDSSVMVALLPEEIRRETRTFTIGFEAGGHHDERVHARRVAEHLGTQHRELVVRPDPAAELPRVVRFLDEPCADPAALPAYLVARAASSEVTVLLSGTGGDEVFGGYRRYRLASLLRAARWVPRALAAAGARVLADGARHRESVGAERIVFLRKLLEARGRGDFGSAYVSTLEPAAPWRWRNVLAWPLDLVSATSTLWQGVPAAAGERPATGTAWSFAFDHLYYLPDDLLLKEDRTTMGASVEGRVPYLDVSLVRFGAALSLDARLGKGQEKRVLRRLATRWLPADVVTRPKHGFSTPIEHWLRGSLAELARDTLAQDGSGLFVPRALSGWLDEHRAGRDRSGGLWAALCFELWWREVGSARPRRSVEPRDPLARAA